MTIKYLFSSHRFGLTHYQREYSWSRKHVNALMSDLRRRFIEAYERDQDRYPDDVATTYPSYFLGSIIYYRDGNTTFVVDGQQRLVTLHLLLIHLRQLVVDQGLSGHGHELDGLIRSRRAANVYTVDISHHYDLLDAFVEGRRADLRANATASERVLHARYSELEEDFPAELRGDALQYFVEWFLDCVCVVGIQATGRDNGWEMFETTNDRGLKLAPFDLVKGHLLAKAKRGQAGLNEKWREMVNTLAAIDLQAPSDFFKTLLLARYVEDPHNGDDRRTISDAFHEWVYEHPQVMGLSAPASYDAFIRQTVVPLGLHYARLRQTAVVYYPDHTTVFFNELNNIPHHLTAVMAVADPTDTWDTFRRKANLVSASLDLLYVRRIVNGSVVEARQLEAEVLGLIVRLRPCSSMDTLRKVLGQEVAALGDDFGNMGTFSKTQNNTKQVRYLLARLTQFCETGIEEPDRIVEYLDVAKPYEIEHIWPNDFDRYRDEVKTRKEFDSFRNMLGALVLLRKSDNASLGAQPYLRKLEVYGIRQNILTAGLNSSTHANHPKFRQFLALHDLAKLFRAHPHVFDKAAIKSRQSLYQRLCEIVWDPRRLGFELPEAQPAKTSSTRRNQRQPQLWPLLEAQLVKPGEKVTGRRRGEHFTAVVRDDGKLEVPTGQPFADIADAGAFVLGNKTCRGWDFWHVTRGGGEVPLKSLRELLPKRH